MREHTVKFSSFKQVNKLFISYESQFLNIKACFPISDTATLPAAEFLEGRKSCVDCTKPVSSVLAYLTVAVLQIFFPANKL